MPRSGYRRGLGARGCRARRTHRRYAGSAGASRARSTRSAAESRVRCVEEALLAWSAGHGRDLPWRRTRDPYTILVSEVMLQQTQVDRVVPRYLDWLERWPTAAALAAASPAEVIRAWQGLGYNRRAVNLQRAAQRVAARGWPDDLTELPGVGRYTADAVTAFAFGAAAVPLAHACPSRGRRFEPLRKQSRFEGSFRQRRARTLRLVAEGERPLAEHDAAAVAALARDGLVRVDNGVVALPTCA